MPIYRLQRVRAVGLDDADIVGLEPWLFMDYEEAEMVRHDLADEERDTNYYYEIIEEEIEDDD